MYKVARKMRVVYRAVCRGGEPELGYSRGTSVRKRDDTPGKLGLNLMR